jgi:hypothetical protein
MAGRPAELHLQRVIAGRRARLLVNAGALLISAAGSVIIHAAAASSVPACPLIIAFCIFVVGVSLVMSALVADRFPRAARAGVVIARALQRSVLGLGW